jgi:hypothetical protein
MDQSSNLPQLAACLFDLRAGLEAEVRHLTWIQRSIEEIRAGRACGDSDLLLREIARLLEESADASLGVAGYRREAVALLASLIAPATKPKALAIVA